MKSIITTTFIVLLISSSNTSSAFISSVSAITLSTNNKSTSFAKEPHTISSSTTKQLLQQQRKATSLNMGSQGLVYGTAVATTFGMQLIGFVAAYGKFFFGYVHMICSQICLHVCSYYDMLT